MRAKRLPRLGLLVLLFALVAGGANASHTDDSEAGIAACGLPASGLIHHANTYDLSGDCGQRAALLLRGAINSDPTGGGVRINGHGFAISLLFSGGVVDANGETVWRFALCEPGVSLTVRDATIISPGRVALTGCDLTVENLRFVVAPAGTEANAAEDDPPRNSFIQYSPIPVGAFAKIFRWQTADDVVMRIWGVDEQTSQGFHLITIAQSDVDAMDGAGMLATSPDCKARVSVDEAGDVTVSAGPNRWGRTLHVAFDDGLQGHVTSTWSSEAETLCPADETVRWLDLSHCALVAADNVNMRDAPNGAMVLNIVSRGRELPAIARVEDWFQVEVFGQVGWLSLDVVTTVGDCG